MRKDKDNKDPPAEESSTAGNQQIDYMNQSSDENETQTDTEKYEDDLTQKWRRHDPKNEDDMTQKMKTTWPNKLRRPDSKKEDDLTQKIKTTWYEKWRRPDRKNEDDLT